MNNRRVCESLLEEFIIPSAVLVRSGEGSCFWNNWQEIFETHLPPGLFQASVRRVAVSDGATVILGKPRDVQSRSMHSGGGRLPSVQNSHPRTVTPDLVWLYCWVSVRYLRPGSPCLFAISQLRSGTYVPSHIPNLISLQVLMGTICW